jgi:DNA ligase-associated metallophosphoesterase
MTIIEEHIYIKGEDLILTSQRAIYWKRENALILSDVHIGKTGHFKKHGIPMPDAILQKDLERLEALINHFKAEKLVVVGDLFHAEGNEDMVTFKSWLQQFENLQIVLIKWNHDRLPKKVMTLFNFQAETELEIGPFLLVHEHLSCHKDKFTISGHTHPGVLVKGIGKQKIKLPCYQVSSNQIILPAFSLFTGLNTREAPKSSNSYAFTDENFYLF